MPWVRLLLSFLLMAFALDPAVAEKRVALVVGNSTYEHVPIVRTAASDSVAVAGLLKAAAFQVMEVRDVKNLEFRRAIREFTALAKDADFAVVFFAGYGVDVRNRNYLVPIDAALKTDIDAIDEAVSLDRLLDSVEAARRLSLVILDTCRGNPFGTINTDPSPGTPSETKAGGRSLIVFAGKSGSRCIDGSEKSPLTAALLKHLATPDLDIRVALGRVQDEVRQATDNRQEPVVNGGGALGGSVLALVQPPGQPAPSTVASPPTVASLPTVESLPAKQERLALVIGNAAYQSGELKNVINDAQSVSAALAGLGFDVTAATNVKGDDLDRTLREFLNKRVRQGEGCRRSRILRWARC